MTLQRACDGANQARNKLSNGPLRAQGNGSAPGVFCDVGGRRHLPGIYWYPAKRTEQAVNQGGTADNVNYSSLTEFRFLSGTFLFFSDGILKSVEGLLCLYLQSDGEKRSNK